MSAIWRQPALADDALGRPLPADSRRWPGPRSEAPPFWARLRNLRRVLP